MQKGKRKVMFSGLCIVENGKILAREGFCHATTHLVLKWSNVEHMLKLCCYYYYYSHRGWRIQWSIVPEVSEPVVNMNLDFLVLLVISSNIIKCYFLQTTFYFNKR